MTKNSYNRIIRVPENFVEQMREMAKKEKINPELAELMARKMLAMSVPEEVPSYSKFEEAFV